MDVRKFSRRQVLAGAGLAGAGAVLAACAPSTPQVVEKEVVVTATAAPSGPVNLVYFYWMSPEQQPMYQAIFDEFSSANPEITIEAQLAPSTEVDKFQKVLLMIAAGTPPDFTAGSSEAPGYAAKNLLVVLDPYIEASGLDMSLFNQEILKSYLQYQGQQIVFPTVASAELLAYNPDLFDAAGLAHPSETWGDPAWDWATFIESGKALTVEKDGKISQFGNTGLLYYMYATRWWGARWADDGVTQISADTAEMAEAIQELADVSLKHHIAPLSAEWELFGDQDPLLSGMSGTQGFGLWSLLQYAEADSNWACASWPSATDPLAFLYPMGFYIFKGSRHPDEAWRFAEYMGTPEANLKWATASSRMPAMPQNGPAWLEYFAAKKPNARMHVITDMLDYPKSTTAEPFIYHPRFSEFATKVITPSLDPVWLGEKTAKEVLPQMQADLEALLAEE